MFQKGVLRSLAVLFLSVLVGFASPSVAGVKKNAKLNVHSWMAQARHHSPVSTRAMSQAKNAERDEAALALDLMVAASLGDNDAYVKNRSQLFSKLQILSLIENDAEPSQYLSPLQAHSQRSEHSLSYYAWILGRGLIAAAHIGDEKTTHNLSHALRVLLDSTEMAHDHFRVWTEGMLLTYEAFELDDFDRYVEGKRQFEQDLYALDPNDHIGIVWGNVWRMLASAAVEDEAAYVTSLHDLGSVAEGKGFQEGEHAAWAMALMRISAAMMDDETTFHALLAPITTALSELKSDGERILVDVHNRLAEAMWQSEDEEAPTQKMATQAAVSEENCDIVCKDSNSKACELCLTALEKLGDLEVGQNLAGDIDKAICHDEGAPCEEDCSTSCPKETPVVAEPTDVVTEGPTAKAAGSEIIEGDPISDATEPSHTSHLSQDTEDDTLKMPPQSLVAETPILTPCDEGEGRCDAKGGAADASLPTEATSSEETFARLQTEHIDSNPHIPVPVPCASGDDACIPTTDDTKAEPPA